MLQQEMYLDASELRQMVCFIPKIFAFLAPCLSLYSIVWSLGPKINKME